VGRPYELTLLLEGSTDVTLRGEFSEQDCEVFDLYLEQYERLAASRPVREGIPCSWSVKWAQDEGGSVTTDLPDDDTLAILLHRLRPFLLSDEPASFARVSARVGRLIVEPHVRQLLRHNRRVYEGRVAQEILRVESDDLLLNSERALFEWLNSHEYHHDAIKRESLAPIFRVGPPELGRAIMVFMLIDKTRSVVNLASLVAVLVGKSQRLTFQIPVPNVGS
jgi:hypothetical protein